MRFSCGQKRYTTLIFKSKSIPTVFGDKKRSNPVERLVLKSNDMIFRRGLDIIRFVGLYSTDVFPFTFNARRNYMNKQKYN